jgi:hypothetical protein
MSLPETYPIKAPKMKIFENQPFDNDFHHHIYGNWISLW